MADFFVDAVSGDDSYDGSAATYSSGTTGPKKTLESALSLITGVINGTQYIYLVPNENNVPFTGDCIMSGIVCVGSGSKLVIQPHEGWNETNYDNADGDPLNMVNAEGDFDPTADKHEVVLGLNLRIWNSFNVELRGLAFEVTSSNCSAGVWAERHSTVELKYCRFAEKNARVVSTLHSIVGVENCHFVDNDVAAYASYGGLLAMVGNNTIEDPRSHGICASMGSQVCVMPWNLHPKTHFTTEIRTTMPLNDRFTAAKFTTGSILTAQDEAIIPNNTKFGQLKLHNENANISAEYFGIALESNAIMTKAGNTTLTHKNANNEVVALPEEQVVVSKTEPGVTRYALKDED